MKRKIALGAAVVWLVLVGGGFAVFYGVASFSYTRLDLTGNGVAARTEEYRWNGEPILIDGKYGKRNFAQCKVVPDNGRPKTFSTHYYVGKSGRSTVAKFEPTTAWFSGSATMTCDEAVSVYSGSGLTMYQLANNRLLWVGVAIVGALPLLAVVVLRSGAIRIQRA